MLTCCYGLMKHGQDALLVDSVVVDLYSKSYQAVYNESWPWLPQRPAGPGNSTELSEYLAVFWLLGFHVFLDGVSIPASSNQSQLDSKCHTILVKDSSRV